MRRSAEAAEFGRLFLRMVELRSRGEWVRFQSILDAVIAAHPDNGYVDYLLNGPGARRAKVTHVIQDVMAEFPNVERRKDGAWQSAPVWYRAVSYRLVDDPVVSRQAFADWWAALEEGAVTFAAGVLSLPEQGIFIALTPAGAGPVGGGVHLTDQFPAPPWVLQINEPTKLGQENILSAIALDSRGRRVLLRQGRLQKNALSELILGAEFRLGTGRIPVSLALPSGDATRDWFLVAELDNGARVIRNQTAEFVAACAGARRLSPGDQTSRLQRGQLFAPDELDESYLVGVRESSSPELIRRLQGQVWQALAKVCAARQQRIRKPLHASGYEVDVELPDAPNPLIIEIKTGHTAADVYTGFGQLALYPRLIPWMRAHTRVLLLRGAPSSSLVEALGNSEVVLHSYEIDETSDKVVFSAEFLAHCGLA